jgi:hypothetical protein
MLVSYPKARRVDESSSVMFAGRDGDNDGTYTLHMVPLVTGMLGLPCRPCWGPRQLKFGDY